MDQLAKAIEIAAKHHAGQVDKAGNPYILHVMRVMFKSYTLNGKIVGVLHDVVEDTEVTLKDLSIAGFPTQIVYAVKAITRNKGEDYKVYVERLAKDRLARQVKLYDLEDHLATSDAIPESLVERYHRAHEYLTEGKEM